jgi:hypothetical protein
MADGSLAGDSSPQRLADVMASARVEVVTRAARKAEQGGDANEELLTEWLLDAAWPSVEYVTFNRREEAVVGADWLWWFLDETGECFGVLVQAKKLHLRSRRLHLELDYPKHSGEQMRRLLASADEFGVPASYVVYCCGHPAREGLECGSHDPSGCEHCARCDVAVLPALIARSVVFLNLDRPQDIASDAYRSLVPLEDLVGAADTSVLPVGFREVSDELKQFLVRPQTGARGVAKLFFDALSEQRKGAFSSFAATSAIMSSEMVFTDLPTDVGHFSAPYWVHALRGLRRELPPMVRSMVLDGEDLPPPEGVAGIAVIHV